MKQNESMQIKLSKSILIKLIDTLVYSSNTSGYYPAPDDPGDPDNPWGPYGPHGPIMDGSMFNYRLQQVNKPQPDPWYLGLLTQIQKPDPTPWKAQRTVTWMIERVASQYKMAELFAGTDQSERMVATVRLQLIEDIDDWCGTRPKKWLFPFPRGPLDLLIAGAEFQRMADSFPESPLQNDFAEAADRLVQTGLKLLENN